MTFRYALILALLLIPPTPTQADDLETHEALTQYIIKVHDEATKCNPCLTKHRARQYAVWIIESAVKYKVPLDISVGRFEWESGFVNNIDKVGSGKYKVPLRDWCFGLGRLKVSTARFYEPLVSGRDLIYYPDKNIEYSTRYLAYCLKQKKGDNRRALNAYKAGCRGETQGKYMITVTMPWGEKVTKEYADWVFTRVDKWHRYRVRYAGGN